MLIINPKNANISSSTTSYHSCHIEKRETVLLAIFSLALAFVSAVIFFIISEVKEQHKKLKWGHTVYWNLWAIGFLPQ